MGTVTLRGVQVVDTPLTIEATAPATALCISQTDTTDYTLTNTLLQSSTPVTPMTFVP